MESREYVTITYGRDPDNLTDYGIGIYAFSDYGIEKLEDKVVPELSDEAYYDAFDTYLSTCESYLKQYTETGEPFDVGNAPRSIFIPLLITIFVPILIAFLVCMIFLSQMKTAIKATQADDYIPRDGFSLTLESGTLTGNIVIDESAKTAMAATPEKAVVREEDTFNAPAPAGSCSVTGAMAPSGSSAIACTGSSENTITKARSKLNPFLTLFFM